MMDQEKLNIPAIPTMYDGVQFRSRLEATWAAFFDLFGWKWEYEPIDCNGWIPDFILYVDFKNGFDTLVEIKPYNNLQEFKNNKVDLKCIDALRGTIYENHNILLLGCSPCFDEYNPILGYENSFYRKIFFGQDFNDIGFFISTYSRESKEAAQGIRIMWRLAKNKTQWKK